MMTASVKLGRIWNVPIGFHWSWLIVFALVTVSFALGVFPQQIAGLSPAAYIALGIITSVLFFGSVLLHELGHTFIALRRGVPVREINLFIFGGVAIMSREPRTAKDEFWIAIAGPLVSFALAGIFAVLWLASGGFALLALPLFWLAWINFILAAFNLIPGFPLDGGRVLRAIVWHIKGNLHKATKFASITGQIVAFGFIAYGVFTLLGGNLFGGLWIAFIGWFLQNAAAAALAHSDLRQSLSDVTVSRIMSPDFPSVEAEMSLRQVVDERLLRGAGRAFFVRRGDGAVTGLLTIKEIGKIPHEVWEFFSAERAMIPFEKLVCVAPQDELITALAVMEENEVAQLPVVRNGEMIGVLSRERILHYISISAELNLTDKAEKPGKVKRLDAAALPNRLPTNADGAA